MADVADSPAPQAETASAGPAPPQSRPWPPRRDAYYSLFAMSVVVMFTVLDRSVLALVIDPIKQDFGISDTGAALLIGAAFSLPYGVAGVGVARLADRGNRRNLVALSIAFWSLCTTACGVAQGFVGLLLMRMGVGAGESGYGPASWSIITDNWPREKVAFATAVQGVGALLGTGLALFLGGAVLQVVSHMPPLPVPGLGVVRPWQWVFIFVGAPGLLCALLVLTTREPPRRGLEPGQKAQVAPVRDVARWLRDDWRTYLAAVGGMCIKAILFISPQTWNATFMHRQFGWDLAKVGLISGAVTLVISPIALLAGARLSERWARKGRDDADLLIVFYSLLAMIPLMIAAPLLPNPWLVLAANALAGFFNTLTFGPSIAAFQVVTPNRMRAQVSALVQFCNNVLAFAVSPLIVALFTDYLFGDSHALGWSMALNAAIMGLLTLAIVWQGLGPYARSYARAVREFAD